MEKKLQHITIQIADMAPISLNIDSEKEAIVRSAERNVNKVWRAWCRSYPEKTSNEVLAMVTYQFAKLYYELEAKVTQSEKMLTDFEQALDRALIGMD